MSWTTLVDVWREARETLNAELSSPPSACPNDGTPLRPGPGGTLYCTFDGWTWGQGALGLSRRR